MTPKRWITIGVVLFVIMTIQNISVFIMTEPGSLEKMGAPGDIIRLVYLAWGVFVGLHILSVAMIAIGVLKKQKMNTDNDIQKLKSKVARLETQKSFCKNCGNGIKNEKFCSKCGFKL